MNRPLVVVTNAVWRSPEMYGASSHDEWSGPTRGSSDLNNASAFGGVDTATSSSNRSPRLTPIAADTGPRPCIG